MLLQKMDVIVDLRLINTDTLVKSEKASVIKRESDLIMTCMLDHTISFKLSTRDVQFFIQIMRQIQANFSTPEPTGSQPIGSRLTTTQNTTLLDEEVPEEESMKSNSTSEFYALHGLLPACKDLGVLRFTGFDVQLF